MITTRSSSLEYKRFCAGRIAGSEYAVGIHIGTPFALPISKPKTENIAVSLMVSITGPSSTAVVSVKRGCRPRVYTNPSTTRMKYQRDYYGNLPLLGSKGLHVIFAITVIRYSWPTGLL